MTTNNPTPIGTSYKVWTSENTKRVLNSVLNSLWESLGKSREGRDLRNSVIEEREAILISGGNDAVKSEGLWTTLNRLVIQSGDVAFDQMLQVKDLWVGKPREWTALYEAKGKTLADKYVQLWAKAPGADHVVIGDDSTLRRLMQEQVKAMFAFTAEESIWAPYGRCASGCGRAIRPDRNGRLHKDCPNCHRASVEVAKTASREDLFAAAVEAGVKFTPADAPMVVSDLPKKPKKASDFAKEVKSEIRRVAKNRQEAPKAPRAGGRPNEYTFDED